jgi:hypothetical protein
MATPDEPLDEAAYLIIEKIYDEELVPALNHIAIAQNLSEEGMLVLLTNYIASMITDERTETEALQHVENWRTALAAVVSSAYLDPSGAQS